MADVQLDQGGSVVLDANGNGTIRLQPSSNRVFWHVTGVSVRTTTNVKEPTAQVYLGAPGGNSLGGTYTGSNDSDQILADVYPGQFLSVVFSGGDAGATAFAYLYGTVSVWGR